MLEEISPNGLNNSFTSTDGVADAFRDKMIVDSHTLRRPFKTSPIAMMTQKTRPRSLLNKRSNEEPNVVRLGIVRCLSDQKNE